MPEENGEGHGGPAAHAGPAAPAGPAQPAELAGPSCTVQGGISAEERGSSEAGLGNEIGRQPGNEMVAEQPVYVSYRETKIEQKSKVHEPAAFFLVDQYGRGTLAVTSVFNGEYTGCEIPDSCPPFQ